jgi:hypothetical protein
MRDSFTNLRPDRDRTLTREFCKTFTLEELLWGSAGQPHLAQHPLTFANDITFGVWDAIVAGEFAQSAFGNRVRTALDDYDCPDGMHRMLRQRSLLFDESAELGERTERALPDLGKMNYIRKKDVTRWFAACHDPGWNFSLRNDYIQSLEAERNHLRRAVDELSEKLQQLGASKA